MSRNENVEYFATFVKEKPMNIMYIWMFEPNLTCSRM